MTRMVTMSARSFGILACNACCSGQTTATMNSAKVTGARMAPVKYAAATPRTKAQTTSEVRTARASVMDCPSNSLQLRPAIIAHNRSRASLEAGESGRECALACVDHVGDPLAGARSHRPAERAVPGVEPEIAERSGAAEVRHVR